MVVRLELECSVPWPGEDGWSPLEWPIDDRERWENQLWIYSDKREQWIEAPRMKVFELGKVGIDVLLRVGVRREWGWKIGLQIHDETYVGDTPEEVALFACRTMPLPATVLVYEYVAASYSVSPLAWLVTVHDDRFVRMRVDRDIHRDHDPHMQNPRCVGEPIYTQREIEGFS